MKPLAYLLILLLVSAPVDDALAFASASPSAPLTDAGDEYLPAPVRIRGEPSSRPQAVADASNLPAADIHFDPKGLPAAWTLTALLTPSPLYVFMSLQI